MFVDEEYIPFDWDEENLYLKICKSNDGELGELEVFELKSPLPDMAVEVDTERRKKKLNSVQDIPMEEWRKRFGMLPEEEVEQMLQYSTCFYLNVEAENRQDPRKYYKYRFPGIRCPRQRETVASDTFFPSVISKRGNTCSQFFVGLTSDRWEVYPLKSESNN
eukprot:15074367-Ditylum_brightwellii.AAC.1